tara:strand:- start:849 stop:1976 length:1128 start_codon:yes stop_codon:yes gene_type:complete
MAFLGISEFKHFVGVVEDRFDPEKLGRLRVRVLGIHTADKNKIATADLPWASVVLPTTSAGISGLGQSPSFIVEGAWVWGYFRDGDLMQEMVIVGTLPGKPAELGNTDGGFYDPNFRLDADGEPTTISVYPKEMGEPDTNRLAVNNPDLQHSSLSQRLIDQINNKNIPTADFDEVGSSIVASDTDNWSQPAITYNAVYPYNHVFESESGHIKEYDDSFIIDKDGIRTNHYRIYERHSGGTSYEIDTAGNRIDLNMASYFNITNKDNKHYIKGNSDVTIDGRHKVYINKSGTANNNYDIQVGPNANVNIQVDNGNLNVVTKTGQFNFDVGADWNMNVGGNYNLNVQGSETKTVEGTTTHNTTGSTTIRGSTIDLNP